MIFFSRLISSMTFLMLFVFGLVLIWAGLRSLSTVEAFSKTVERVWAVLYTVRGVLEILVGSTIVAGVVFFLFG